MCRYKIEQTAGPATKTRMGIKGFRPIAIFGERDMFKFKTENNNMRNMENVWDHGFFRGVSPGTTEYRIGSGDDVYSCATMRRLEEDKAFDPSVIKETKMRYRNYILEGAIDPN